MFEKKVTVEERKRLEREAKKEEKAREKKKEKPAGKKNTLHLGSIIIPFVLAAAAVFLLRFAIKSSAVSEDLKKEVVVASVDLHQNQKIKEEEKDKYFKTVMIDAEAVPKDTYPLIKSLPAGDFFVEKELRKDQMVFPEDLSNTDPVMDKYEAGYKETSLKVDDFNNSVSGSVREGDIVDIYAIDPATDLLTLLVTDVYVKAAYNNSGDLIGSENADEPAVDFTIYVTPEETEAVNNALSYGGIQLYRKTDE